MGWDRPPDTQAICPSRAHDRERAIRSRELGVSAPPQP